MNPLIPSQTALVLGGGGAKGAYEIGAITALRELGIEAGSVYGTSIGALNAAMYAQGTMERAEALWERLRLSDLVTAESMQLADDAEEIFGRPEKLLEFITRYAQHKGIDVSPFRRLIDEQIDEERIRKSSVKLGVMTAKFPSMARVPMRLSDMEPGSLRDWLWASCACFPVFPMAHIGEERYIDGGFVDNVPLAMAVEDGAAQIIAIDIGRHPAHLHLAHRPNITYIRATHPLGGLLTFDPDVSTRNRVLGYNDTMRAFNRLRGTKYAFEPGDALMLRSRAQRFVTRLTQLDFHLQREGAALFPVLEEGLRPGADCIDYFLRACELCAEIAGMNPAQVFTFEDFLRELRMLLPLEKAEAMESGLLGGRIGTLFAPPQPEKKLVIACLYHILQRDNAFSPLAMRTLIGFPKEMLCAYTLKEIL